MDAVEDVLHYFRFKEDINYRIEYPCIENYQDIIGVLYKQDSEYKEFVYYKLVSGCTYDHVIQEVSKPVLQEESKSATNGTLFIDEVMINDVPIKSTKEQIYRIALNVLENNGKIKRLDNLLQVTVGDATLTSPIKYSDINATKNLPDLNNAKFKTFVNKFISLDITNDYFSSEMLNHINRSTLKYIINNIIKYENKITNKFYNKLYVKFNLILNIQIVNLYIEDDGSGKESATEEVVGSVGNNVVVTPKHKYSEAEVPEVILDEYTNSKLLNYIFIIAQVNHSSYHTRLSNTMVSYLNDRDNLLKNKDIINYIFDNKLVSVFMVDVINYYTPIFYTNETSLKLKGIVASTKLEKVNISKVILSHKNSFIDDSYFQANYYLHAYDKVSLKLLYNVLMECSDKVLPENSKGFAIILHKDYNQNPLNI